MISISMSKYSLLYEESDWNVLYFVNYFHSPRDIFLLVLNIKNIWGILQGKNKKNKGCALAYQKRPGLNTVYVDGADFSGMV